MEARGLVADDGFGPHTLPEPKMPPGEKYVPHEIKRNKRVGKFQVQIWQKGDQDVFNVKVWDTHSGHEVLCVCGELEEVALLQFDHLDDEAAIQAQMEE